MARSRASSPGSKLRRLAIIAGLVLVGLYLGGAVAGYSWVRFVRKNDHLGFTDVLLLRWPAVRRSIGAQQFSKARGEWDGKKYQSAYIWFTAALRNDPDNIAGRLDAARFLESVGGAGMAVTVLEEGLARSPENPELIERTYALLFATGRDRQVLELLRKRALSGPNALLLRTYEVRATQNVEGAAAAQRLLVKYPELTTELRAAPVVAQVRWESQQRLAAIELLARYVATRPDDLAPYARLAEWQEAGGISGDAVRTLQLACVQFPRLPAPRVLLLGALVAGTPEWQRELDGFLREFGGQREAVASLAMQCGEKGWVEVARALYLAAANRHEDLGLLALSYGDALARNSRMKEFAQLLEQLEAQTADTSVGFIVLLRQRQVFAATALGDLDRARDYARRLAAALRDDPEQLEQIRRRFVKLGLVAAAGELAAPTSAGSAKKSRRRTRRERRDKNEIPYRESNYPAAKTRPAAADSRGENGPPSPRRNASFNRMFTERSPKAARNDTLVA